LIILCRETGSSASAEFLNSNKSLGSNSKIQIKQAADHADLVFTTTASICPYTHRVLIIL
jgi:hypothetical protein